MTTATDTAPDLEALVAEFGDLATLAPVAMEVIRVVEDEDSSMVDVANAIKVDPALSARLLRLANSAAYAQRNEVTTIERAAALLGSHTIKLISLGFTLAGNFGGSGIDTTLVWRRSIAGSVLAQRIASSVEPRATDEAFVAGLLANVGKLALADQPHYVDLVARSGPWIGADLEVRALGFSTDALTSRILEGWGLPSILTDAILARTEANPEAETALGDILAVADAAAILIVIDGGEEAAAAFDVLRLSAAARLGLSVQQIEEMITQVKPTVDELMEMFDLDVTSTAPTEIMLAAQTQLTRLSLEMAGALVAQQQRNTELVEENEQLSTAASTDALTGLPNRRTFDAYLDGQISARRRAARATALGLVLFDIDHFKSVNDTHGHAVGDEVLVEVGRRVGDATRRNELSARIGGEEFALVMPDTGPSELEPAAERFRVLIGEEPIETSVGPLAVTVSVGATHITTAHEGSAAELYETADRALYQSKDGGRNRSTILNT